MYMYLTQYLHTRYTGIVNQLSGHLLENHNTRKIVPVTPNLTMLRLNELMDWKKVQPFKVPATY